jgi:hypothetical protein
MAKSEIHTLDMVRKIRDEQAAILAKKSEAEIIEFFRCAGEQARVHAREGRTGVTSGPHGKSA